MIQTQYETGEARNTVRRKDWSRALASNGRLAERRLALERVGVGQVEGELVSQIRGTIAL